MCEHGLVLLGQQAVISNNPTVARVRVKGKYSPEEEYQTLSRGKAIKPLQLSTKYNDRVSGSGGGSEKTLVKKSSARQQLGNKSHSIPYETPSTCRIAKSIRLTGERRVKRRSSSYCPSSTASTTAANSTNGQFTNTTKAVTLRPVYHQHQHQQSGALEKGGGGGGGGTLEGGRGMSRGQSRSRSRSGRHSPYAGSKRHNRCLSAGSVLLHSKNSKGAAAWIPGGGGGGGRHGNSGGLNNNNRSRNRSESVSNSESSGGCGPQLNFRQRTFHAQVDVLIRETRSRGENTTTSEKRRLRRLSHSQQLQEGAQKQKRLSTAEKKARQARIEELILIQQQKAILRVEERRKYAAAQRQRAVADENERRHKARERYRLREAEQERRRKQIYALNCIMRQVEERCFEHFKETMERKNSVTESHSSSADEEDLSDCDSECQNNSDESGDTTINLACKI